MRSAARDIGIVLAVSWLARAVFVAAIGDAHSMDVTFWVGAVAAQDEGRNPYETGVLNWPPLWLQIIVTLDSAAKLTGVAFLTALRVYLVLVESALVAALYLTLVSVGAERVAVRRALLVGIALNPVTILLVCQHGNSDVNVGLLVTLAAAALIAHWRSRDVLMWLAGCLFLGLGVLAKTVPLVLAPLLAPGARLASRAGKALGATLLLGPTALGVSVIFALAPIPVWNHVLGYRSTRGFFGLSGVLDELTSDDVSLALGTALAVVAVLVLALLLRRLSHDGRLAPNRSFLLATALVLVVAWLAGTSLQHTSIDPRSEYQTVFTIGALVGVVWLWRRLYREEPPAPPRLFLLVAVIFMIVVAFGPGYGPQYAYWFLPALIATYVLLDDSWRRLLRVAYVVAALTYAVEYAFVPWLGRYASAILGNADWIGDVSTDLDVPYRLVLFRIPLFVVYVVVIAEGIARLHEARATEHPVASPQPAVSV